MDMQVITAPPGEAPRLAALAPPVFCSGEVVIDVRAALVPDVPPSDSRPPHVPGAVGSGVVSTAAYGFDQGERVAFSAYMRCKLCPGCKARPQLPCRRVKSIGVVRQGALATQIHVPRTNVLRLPDGLEHPDAVAALANYPQALRCIRDSGGIQPGDSVWVEGITTTLGRAIAHLVEQFGGAVVGPDTDTDSDAKNGIAAVVLAGAVQQPAAFHAAVDRLGEAGVVIAAPHALDTPITLTAEFLSRPGPKLVTAHLPSHKDAEAVVAWLASTAFRPESRTLTLADVPQLWTGAVHPDRLGPPVVAEVTSRGDPDEDQLHVPKEPSTKADQ